MKDYIFPIVIAFLVTWLVIVVTYYFHIRKRYTAIIEEEKIQNGRIINGLTSDPYEALYHVRKHIIRSVPNAPSIEAWIGRANDIMYDWLTSVEAQRLSFKDPKFVKGTVNGTSRTWLSVTMVRTSLPTTNVILDLSQGLITTKCQGGTMVHVASKDANAMDFVIPAKSAKASDYDGKAVVHKGTF